MSCASVSASTKSVGCMGGFRSCFFMLETGFGDEGRAVRESSGALLGQGLGCFDPSVAPPLAVVTAVFLMHLWCALGCFVQITLRVCTYGSLWGVAGEFWEGAL